MRIRNTLWMLAGGALTFGACAAHVADAPPTLVSDSGVLDALRDSLGVDLDPEATADATPGDPPTAKIMAACDRTAGAVTYAEVTQPGRAKEDLARAVALVCSKAPGTTAPPGYMCFVRPAWVRDGAIAVNCDPGDAVTFVVPPPI